MFNNEDEKSVINHIAKSCVEGLPYHMLSIRKANAIVFELPVCHPVQLSAFRIRNTIA